MAETRELLVGVFPACLAGHHSAAKNDTVLIWLQKQGSSKVKGLSCLKVGIRKPKKAIFLRNLAFYLKRIVVLYIIKSMNSDE